MKSAASSERSAVSRKKSAVGWWKTLLFCSLLTAHCSLACSIPNLEKPECEQSRNTVREFYSVHFDGEMKPSEEYLKRREKFLTTDLRNSISKNLSDERDYFTGTSDYPKAFRVGDCQVAAPDKTIFSILVFWKTDTRTEQREIKVEAVKENDKWLVSDVKSDNK